MHSQTYEFFCDDNRAIEIDTYPDTIWKAQGKVWTAGGLSYMFNVEDEPTFESSEKIPDKYYNLIGTRTLLFLDKSGTVVMIQILD